MKQNFIRTTDKDTSEILLKEGFQKVSDSNGVYIFLNKDKIKFSENIDKRKISFTNIFCA